MKFPDDYDKYQKRDAEYRRRREMLKNQSAQNRLIAAICAVNLLILDDIDQPFEADGGMLSY